MAPECAEQATRNRSISTGTSGLPEHEHKRPRLDIEPVAASESWHESESIMAEVPRSRTMSPDNINTSQSPSHATPPPLPPNQQKGKAVTNVISPVSKMAILTRSLSSQSTSITREPETQHSETSDTTITTPQSGQQVEAEVEASVQHTKREPELISISSTPEPAQNLEDDLEIEIYPPQDISDSEPTTDALFEPSVEKYLWETMPYVNDHSKAGALRVLKEIIELFDSGMNENIADVTRNVATWLRSNVDLPAQQGLICIQNEAEIYKKVATMVHALFRRRLPTPVELPTNDLVLLASSFIRVSVGLAQADLQFLSTISEPLPVGQLHWMPGIECLRILPFTLLMENTPIIWETVMRHKHRGGEDFHETLIKSLTSDEIFKILRTIAKLFKALSEKIQSTSPGRLALFYLVQAFRAVLQLLVQHGHSTEQKYLASLHTLIEDFITSADSVLQQAIIKQNPWLSIENCQMCVDGIVHSVGLAGLSSPSIVKFALERAKMEHWLSKPLPDIDCCAEALKMAFQKQLIQQGRMELRVSGMDQMANFFVSQWTKTMKLPPKQSQGLVEFVIDFVRRNDMIRYILSAECHPQVIQRSANIFGFLCISGNWEQSDTDAAWHAILTSQDHRSRSAVIEQLKASFEHLGAEPLLYLLTKLEQTSFDKVDTRILDLVLELLHVLRVKHSHNTDLHLDINSQVCQAFLHLLRESHTPPRASSDIAGLVRHHVSEMISQQGGIFLDSSGGRDLLRDICNDIRERNEYANGSIIALTALLKALSPLKAAELVNSYELALLLVNDIAHLSDLILDATNNMSAKQADIQLNFRSDSILALNRKVPQAFDAPLCHLYWNHVLASRLPKTARTRVWKDLASVAAQPQGRAPLLDFVSTQLLQNLGGIEISTAVLDFTKAMTIQELRQHNKDVDPDEPLHLKSSENVWRIMLETQDEEVKVEATKFIVNVHLDADFLNKRSQASINQTHILLVERCMQIVQTCARLLPDENMHNAGESSATQQCSQIHRSLELLKSFLDAMKLKPRYKLATDPVGPLLVSFEQRGDPFDVCIRIVGHSRLRTESATWTIGKDNTAEEIYQFLVDVTGWSLLNLLHNGTRLHLQGNSAMMKDIKLGLGPISVSKHLHAEEVNGKGSTKTSWPVDSQVMHHFDDLYALLESTEAVAKAVYGFLTMFPPQGSIVADIKSMSHSATDMLPVDKPFKLLYFTTALRACIEEEALSNNPNSSFLVYAVHAIVDTLRRLQAIELAARLRQTILNGQVEALQLALRSRIPEDVSKSYLGDSQTFVSTIVEAWKSLNSSDNLDFAEFTRHVLTVLLEAPLYQADVWTYLEDSQDFNELFAANLLTGGSIETRQAVQAVIQRIAGVNDGKLLKSVDSRSLQARFTPAQITENLKSIWRMVRPLLVQACDYPEVCRETLESSVALLQVIAKELEADYLLLLYDELQATLLRQHNPTLGILCSQEIIIQALTKLVSTCGTALKDKGQTVPDADDLVRKSYQQLLFPPLSDDSRASLHTQSTPIIGHEARAAVYDMILMAIQSRQTLKLLVNEMADSAVDEDAFLCQFVNEKKALKSNTGYSGLRNLSNTCYLNSLFSQLFMNLKFRSLIMGIEIVDPEKQKLLSDLGNCFASMQSSSEKYVDPTDAVEAITQYTGEPIDVSVQMDVDEFFNLLFDRLEAQIVDADSQKAFKSMYGGTLVQQIKSKECEHVSERTEPFSAVQIEIRGKTGLEEGLAAYVEGEVLQGDNKYSCTGCGRHVDAVKRACIKDLPDNLIFNLKRFDYDIMTGMRAKINDEFSFPKTIDMTPYTMDALSAPTQSFPSDLFELVGVIVHSGTAETGHYYSFIRERPTKKSYDASWVQFNDADVTQFDPDELKDQAFGGQDSTFSSLAKFYNGYMLFYQRQSSIRQYETDYSTDIAREPATVPLRRDLEISIAMENEITIRRYVAQDPAHAQFVKNVTQLMRNGDQACSDTHELENNLLSVALTYIQQVGSRWKDLPDFEVTIKTIIRYVQSCWKCALFVCDWARSDRVIFDCILRTSSLVARKAFAQLFTTCFEKLFKFKQSEANCSRADSEAITEVLKHAFTAMINDWTQIQKLPRGWEQLFGMLVNVADIGPLQCRFLIELEFLERAIEIAWVHAGPGAKGTPRSVRQKYNIYFAQRDKHRAFSHTPALNLFAKLLPGISLDELQVIPKDETLQPSEAELFLLQIKDDGPFEWLRRMIHYGAAQQAACEVVRELCVYSRLLPRLSETLITVGVLSTREYHAAARFLEPTLTFVATVPERKYAIEAVNTTLHAVADTDGYCAEDYCSFVQSLAKLRTTNCGLDAATIRLLILKNVEWWAPMLLLASEDLHRNNRQEAVVILNDLLFFDLQSKSTEEIRDDEMIMSFLRALSRGCTNHFAKYFAGMEQDRSSSRIQYSTGQNRQMYNMLEEIAQLLESIPGEFDTLREIRATMTDLQMLDSAIEESSIHWDENSEVVSEADLSEVSP